MSANMLTGYVMANNWWLVSTDTRTRGAQIMQGLPNEHVVVKCSPKEEIFVDNVHNICEFKKRDLSEFSGLNTLR